MDLLQEIELNLLEWRKTIQLVHREEIAMGTNEMETEAIKQENLRRQAKSQEGMELTKRLQLELKKRQDEKA